MSAFDLAAADIAADANIGITVTYFAGGAGGGQVVRAIRTMLQPAIDMYQRVRAGNDQLRVLMADIPGLAPGDTFHVAESDGSTGTLEVLDRHPDAENTTWDVTLRRTL